MKKTQTISMYSVSSRYHKRNARRELNKAQGKGFIGIIPARIGSKGLERKNVKKLGGLPLIEHTINEAKKATYLKKTIVSTDSEEIASLSRDLGMDIPFIRPSDLSGDDVPMMLVLRHAVEELENIGCEFEYIVCLQPTSPFRRAKHIDEAIKKFLDEGCRALASVCHVKDSPFWMVKEDNGIGRPFIEEGWKINSRQLLPELYKLNGAIFIYGKEHVKECISLPQDIGIYKMPRYESVDIDDELDWMLAEALMENMDES